MNRLVCLFFSLVWGSTYAQDITTDVREPKLPRTYTLRIDTIAKTLKLKPFGSLKPEVNLNLTTYYTVAQARAQTDPNPVSIFNLNDKVRAGLFYYDPVDTNTTDDGGAFTLVDKAGHRFKRLIADNRITPQMFGAIPDDNIDDWAALNAWLNYSGSYEHTLTAGVFLSSDSLVRKNKGGFFLKGAGQGKSIIRFYGNSDGLKVKNVLNQKAYGAITMTDFELQSTGTKTGEKTGLFINSEHEQFPGPTIRSVTIRCVGVSENQWTRGLWFYNTGHSTSDIINIYGIDRKVMTSVVYSTASNRSSVEHNLVHFSLFNAKRAIFLDSPLSSPQGHGNEGIQISEGSTYGIFEGIIGTISNRAPMIGITNVHVATLGGEALHLDGYTDVKIRGAEFNTYTAPNGTIPARSVYLANIALMTGDFTVLVLGNIPVGTELKGRSGGINLIINGSFNSAQTYFVKQDATVYGTISSGGGIWTGDTTWGSNPHPTTTIVGNGIGRQPATVSVKQALEGDVLRFTDVNNQYVYEPVKPHVTNVSTYTITTGGVNRISLADFDQIFVATPTSTTLVLDRRKAPFGKKIGIARLDEAASAVVTLVSDNPKYNLIQDFDLASKPTILFPQGAHPQQWEYVGGIFKLVSGGTGLNPTANLSDLTNLATARTNLGLGSMSLQNTSGVGTYSMSGTIFLASTSGLAFGADGNIKMDRGANGEMSFTGPIGNTGLSSFRVNSLGRTDFTINSASKSALSLLNFDQASSTQWKSGIIDASQTYGLIRTGVGTVYSSSRTGLTTIGKNAVTIPYSGTVQINSSLQQAFTTSASDPTTSDIPAGYGQFWKNTTSGELRWWANDGGKMKKGTLLTP